MTLHVNIYYCTYTYIIHKVYIIHTRTATATYLQRTIIRHQDIYRIYSWFSSPLFWMGWDCFFMYDFHFVSIFLCKYMGTKYKWGAQGKNKVLCVYILCSLPPHVDRAASTTNLNIFCIVCWQLCFFLDKIQSFYLVFLMNPSLPQSPYLSP